MPVIPLIASCAITSEHVESVTDRLSELAGPVGLMIHTNGGYFQPVMQLARAVQRHGKVTAIVPYYALSGGTLIALAAKSVHLWPHAALGPVDPQIGPFSAGALAAVLQAKSPEHIDDYTLGLAHESRKALAETTRLLRSLIGDNAAAMQRLVSGGLPHSYPITFEEAKGLGLAVERIQPNAHSRTLTQALVSRHSMKHL
jgi:ClpP class serine protease